MNKRKFIGIAGGTVIATGITAYLLSDSPKERLLRWRQPAVGTGRGCASANELILLE